MGGGVALLDYDNDGRLDVFFTNGAKLEDSMPAGRRPDKSDPAFWNRLYRQPADGTFEDVTAKAGVSGATQNQYGMGVAAGDYDNDGFADLYVTSYGAQHALPQHGQRHIRRRHRTGRRRGRRMERQRRVLRLRQRRQARSLRDPLRRLGFREEPLLRREETWISRLLSSGQFRSDQRTSSFTTMATAPSPMCRAKSGIARVPGKGLGVAFADYDGDGFTDVYVANDSVQSFLFHNNGNGTFEEVGPGGWCRLH